MDINVSRFTAIVLAAGAGKRMNSDVHKQYLALAGKPVLYYSLRAFEESNISDIVLVVGKGEIDYCKKEIVDRYHITKVSHITEGGRERYNSVYEGLKCAAGSDYVLIHDGARPLVSREIIDRSMIEVARCDACIVGMPVKDTIKKVDEEGFAIETPQRKSLWQVQTPQSFSYELIMEAYGTAIAENDDSITDDAMVVEKYSGRKVKVIEGSYTNIKITTPEDIQVAEGYIKNLLT
jgi:2-C-methyl-D-erythritol 4-phosphate cytidylyltransferase